MGTEVHHLQHQSEADSEGYINKNGYKIHKNNEANLITLCETCHHDFHSSQSSSQSSQNRLTTVKVKKQHKKVKTTIGIQIQEI
jgi:5-methylcytosine-specific restriction endonuclease McrA